MCLAFAWRESGKPRKHLRIISVRTDIWNLDILYTKLYLHLTTTFCRSASNNVLRVAPYGTACIVIHQYCDTPVLWHSSIVTLQYCDTPVLWQSSIVTLQYCDTPVFWHSSIVTLQYCDTPVLWHYIIHPQTCRGRAVFFIDVSCGILLYNGYRVFHGGK